MLLLAASLCRGHSGVRPEVVQLLVDLLNTGITPVIPSRGSVGASGDLAPLSHLAQVLIGEGEVTIDGAWMLTAEAMQAHDVTPIELAAKEGLALINGTHMMASLASLAVADARLLFDAALKAAAMAIDAARATDSFLDPRLHEARNQAGQCEVAAILADLLSGSGILQAHLEDDPRVQDPYCLRASPQVLGAALDAINHVDQIVTRELGAVTDNPLVFPGDHEQSEFVSGGNFHGMPLAIAMDTLAIALAHVAGISERRVNWILSALDSENPVTAHLSTDPGLHSGLMITQYTAAALCNELQGLATPASVRNIPTCAGMEDYNSMGATSSLQAASAIELSRNVIAIELLVMAEAIEHQRPHESGDGVERIHEQVRQQVPRLDGDRSPSPDIQLLADLIGQGWFQKD